MAMTYAEQLRHPNWQRKRLERLEVARWECENCGAQENTLHVHHRQYFKGRMAWEYDDDELQVLCDECHTIEHANLDSLRRYLSLTPAGEVVALVAGFYSCSPEFQLADRESDRSANELVYAAGFIANMIQCMDIDKMLLVARFAASLERGKYGAKALFAERGNVFGEDLGAKDADGETSAESHPA